MATTTQTDKRVGLGLLFSVVAVAGAAATAALGYTYAVQHAAGQPADAVQTSAGLAFAASILAASLAVTAIHVYGN